MEGGRTGKFDAVEAIEVVESTNGGGEGEAGGVDIAEGRNW